MIPDIEFIQKSFDRFNALCFEGALPPVALKLSRARTFIGKLTYTGKRDLFGNVVPQEDFCIRINTCYDLPENELEDVIIHEMIHYYIIRNRIHDTSAHGKVFRRIMKTINSKYGRNISVSYRVKTKPTPLFHVELLSAKIHKQN